MHTRLVMRTRLALITLAVPFAVAVSAAPVEAKMTPTAAPTVVNVKMTEFRFILSKKVVPHGLVTFIVENVGNVQHDFFINGKKTLYLNPGRNAVLRVMLPKKGLYNYTCTIPEHAAAGMEGVLKVT